MMRRSGQTIFLREAMAENLACFRREGSPIRRVADCFKKAPRGERGCRELSAIFDPRSEIPLRGFAFAEKTEVFAAFGKSARVAQRKKVISWAMTAVGFEPTQLALVELESTPLDHSGKVFLGCRWCGAFDTSAVLLLSVSSQERIWHSTWDWEHDNVTLGLVPQSCSES